MPKSNAAMAAETREMPMQHMQAAIRALPRGKEDEEALPENEFEVVMSTGATVRRFDWWSGKRYDEQLIISEKAVSLARLNDGATVLNSHNAYDLGDVLGAVVPGSVRIEGGQIVGRVRIYDGPENASVLGKIRAGIIRHLSIGYVVHTYTKIEREGQPELWRADKWDIYEVSFVAVPADPGAKLRAEQQRLYPCEFTITNQRKEETMSKKSPTLTARPAEDDADLATRGSEPEPTPEPTDPAPAPGKDEESIRREERARAREILNLVRAGDLADTFADGLIERGLSVQQAGVEILKERARKQKDEQGQIRATGQVQVGADEQMKTRAAVEEALLHRYSPGQHQMTDGGRHYRGLSLLEIGRDLLERRGVKTRGLARAEVAKLALGLDVDGLLSRAGMLGTSDFPYVLANTASKLMRGSYEAMPQTFKPISRQVTLTDFKTKNIVQLGEASKLEKVNEGGEYKYGSLPEAQETMSLLKYGKIIAITWEAIINDDMDAFTTIPSKMGAQVLQLESDVVWGALLSNPTMADGSALFDDTAHSNHTSSGTAIDVTSLGVARKKVRLQKGLDATTVLNLQPKFLVVPPTKETIAQQYLATERIVMTKASDFNPFAGTLQLIVEPRLETTYLNPATGASITGSTTAWYLAVDPALVDTVWYAYLEGQNGPVMDSRVGFEVDGLELKIRHVVAAKPIDHRGLYKNAGA